MGLCLDMGGGMGPSEGWSERGAHQAWQPEVVALHLAPAVRGSRPQRRSLEQLLPRLPEEEVSPLRAGACPHPGTGGPRLHQRPSQPRRLSVEDLLQDWPRKEAPVLSFHSSCSCCQASQRTGALDPTTPWAFTSPSLGARSRKTRRGWPLLLSLLSLSTLLLLCLGLLFLSKTTSIMKQGMPG